MTVFEDIKTIRNYVLGVIAFATSVSAFLTAVFHTNTEVTIGIAAGIAGTALFMGWLVERSSKRSADALKQHATEANALIEKWGEDIVFLKEMAIENRRAVTRLEMNDIIKRNPSNHDTILKIAQRYFVELEGDWYETAFFLKWIEDEKAAGRVVPVPPQLFAAVNDLHASETFSIKK